MSNHDPISFPPSKKVDSILKPKKTTRTMNPESEDTMKHRTMLGRSSQVNIKERVTRSSLKKGDSVMDMDDVGYEDGSLGVDGVNNDVDEAELIFRSVNKVSNMSTSVDKPEIVNSAINSDIHMNGNGGSSNDTSSSATVSGSRVVLNEVKIPGMFKVVGDGSMLNKGIGSVSNFEVRQHSDAMDSDLNRFGELKQSMSFASAISKSFGGVGNNKLKFVSEALNDEGREVAMMDPVLEEGIEK
ncbi:hypothetical protein Tco_1160712 [Tanacetum coccineum]